MIQVSMKNGDVHIYELGKFPSFPTSNISEIAVDGDELDFIAGIELWKPPHLLWQKTPMSNWTIVGDEARFIMANIFGVWSNTNKQYRDDRKRWRLGF